MALKPQPLDDRLKAIRDEVDAFINDRVAEMKKTIEGVPEGVLRQTIVGRYAGCLCESYSAIRRQDDEQAAREGAA